MITLIEPPKPPVEDTVEPTEPQVVVVPLWNRHRNKVPVAPMDLQTARFFQIRALTQKIPCVIREPSRGGYIGRLVARADGSTPEDSNGSNGVGKVRT